MIFSNDKKLIKKNDNNCKNKFINKSIPNYFIFNDLGFSIYNYKNENSFEKTDSNNSDDNLIQFNSESNIDYKLHNNQNEKKSNKAFFFLLFLIILVVIIILVMKLINVI